jgi:hypothetical protein
MIGHIPRVQIAAACYSDRNETLRLIGFKSYSAYTRSKLWKIIRARAFELLGRDCKRCNRPANQIHHASYSREVLTGEDVRGLMPLCAGCHRSASLTNPNSKALRLDGIQVKSLHETNMQLARRFRRPPKHRNKPKERTRRKQQSRRDKLRNKQKQQKLLQQLRKSELALTKEPTLNKGFDKPRLAPK